MMVVLRILAYLFFLVTIFLSVGFALNVLVSGGPVTEEGTVLRGLSLLLCFTMFYLSSSAIAELHDDFDNN
jgi:hypothetical protein